MTARAEPPGSFDAVPRRVVLVDDDPAVHGAVREHLLHAHEPWHVTAYNRGAAALNGLGACVPHVVLMDIGMPEMTGLECAQRIKLQYPRLPVVMLTGKAKPELVLNALCAGARGYLVKNPLLIDLVPLVSKAIAGGLALCPHAEQLLMEAMNRLSLGVARWGLTRREEEVLLGLCHHGPEKEVANALGISSATVHVHVRTIFHKLGVHDRSAAVQKFLKTLPHPGGGVTSLSSEGLCLP